MKEIMIKDRLIVDRIGAMVIFCHIEGHRPYLLTSNPYCDIIIRTPSLLTDINDPESVIFTRGDIIEIQIRYEGKEKKEDI